MSVRKEIWILAECERGELSESSLEILGEALAIARGLKCGVTAFLLGADAGNAVQKLAEYGAGIIRVCERPELEHFDAGRFAQVIYDAELGDSPLMLLSGATPDGIAVASRLAAKWGCALCDKFVSATPQEDGSLLVAQSVLGGVVHSLLKLGSNRSIVLLADPGSIGVGSAPKSTSSEESPVEVQEMPEAPTRFEEVIKADPRKVALDEADFVAAGGLGFASNEDFQLMRDLADALGAAVAGSKPVFDNQWVSRQRFVGQSSGRKLAPRLFVAVGISGSNYFLGGMKGSQTLVAINKDKGAPLMQSADLAVVGDLHEVVPALIATLNERKGAGKADAHE